MREIWKKIKSFFTSEESLETTTGAISTVEELQTVADSWNTVSNISRSSEEEVESIISVDDRLAITGFVFSVLSYALSLVRYIRNPNKNATNTSNIFIKTVLFGFNILLTLVSFSLIVIATPLSIAAIIISLTADTLYNFYETIKYAYLTVTARTLEEARAFAPKIFYHVKGAIFAGIFAITATLLAFDLPILGGLTVAAIVIATIAAVITSTPFILWLGSLAKKGISRFKNWLSPQPAENKPNTKITLKANLEANTDPLVLSVLKNKYLNTRKDLRETVSTIKPDQTIRGYYKNTIVIARPAKEIQQDIETHIEKLTKSVEKIKLSFIDRMHIEKRKEKISGLNMLLMFIEKYSDEIKNNTTATTLNIYYPDITGNETKTMAIGIESANLTTSRGRQHIFSEIQKVMQTKYPSIFNQFSFTSKHSMVRKLFSEVQALLVQPTLPEIIDAIATAGLEAQERQKTSFIKKISPFSGYSITLRERSHGDAFAFLGRIAYELKNGNLDTYVQQKYFTPENLELSSYLPSYRNDIFNLLEEKLQQLHPVKASFDIFGEGKLATLFNQLHNYHKRFPVIPAEPSLLLPPAASLPTPSLSTSH